MHIPRSPSLTVTFGWFALALLVAAIAGSQLLILAVPIVMWLGLALADLFAQSIQTALAARNWALDVIRPFGPVLFAPSVIAWLLCRKSQLSLLRHAAPTIGWVTAGLMIVAVCDFAVVVLPLSRADVEGLAERVRQAGDILDLGPVVLLLLYGVALAVVLGGRKLPARHVLRRWRTVTFVKRIEHSVSTAHSTTLVVVQIGINVAAAGALVGSTIALAGPPLVGPVLQARVAAEKGRSEPGKSAPGDDVAVDRPIISWKDVGSQLADLAALDPGPVEDATRLHEAADGIVELIAIAGKKLPLVDRMPSALTDPLTNRVKPWLVSHLEDAWHSSGNGSDQSAPNEPQSSPQPPPPAPIDRGFERSGPGIAPQLQRYLDRDRSEEAR